MKIVMIPVANGTGCDPCYYAESLQPCSHPSEHGKERNCSSLLRRDKVEQIYLTEEKAALARLRGTYNSKL